MSMLHLGGAVLVAAPGTALIGLAAPAHADSFQQCIDQAETHDGEPPTCTEVNGSYVASWPDDGLGGGGGIPGGFAVFFVLALVIGIGVTFWKVSTARRLATDSGMDPDLASQMTLLTENGLDATYLAASLRSPAPASPAAPPDQAPQQPASTAHRLQELKNLLEGGLVTQTEYDERRKAIIDAV